MDSEHPLQAIIDQDTPIHVRTILEMSDDELDKLTDHIRSVRLQARQLYQDSLLVAKSYKLEQDKERLFKQCDMLKREMDKIGKLEEAINKRVAQVRVLRLSVEGLLPEVESYDGRK